MNTKLNKMQEALKSLDEAARLHITSTKNFNPDCYFIFYNSFNSSSFYLAAASSASLVQGNPFSKFS